MKNEEKKYDKQELKRSIQAFEQIGEHIRILPDVNTVVIGKFAMSSDFVRAIEISIELMKKECKTN